jgi:hypothetical protein
MLRIRDQLQIKASQAKAQVPLTNLPGVTCTSGGSGGAVATLNSNDRNVYLSRGSKMLVAISASH